MFVGDAAAATDVMTGEGIGQALLTGRLAAEAILAAGTADPAAARAALTGAGA
jgi:flavin-dependent dehydrogenase